MLLTPREVNQHRTEDVKSRSKANAVAILNQAACPSNRQCVQPLGVKSGGFPLWTENVFLQSYSSGLSNPSQGGAEWSCSHSAVVPASLPEMLPAHPPPPRDSSPLPRTGSGKPAASPRTRSTSRAAAFSAGDLGASQDQPKVRTL